MTYGASGKPINTVEKCVYSRACAVSGGLHCFEQTGCKYQSSLGAAVAAEETVNPSNPCESLSKTDPAPCPMTYGASGKPINMEKTCVYSAACAASGGLDCFEQTGCKYKSSLGAAPAAEETATTETDPCAACTKKYKNHCNKSPWWHSKDDHRCVCGVHGSDWHRADDC